MLTVRLLEPQTPSGSAELLCVLCHGYGAPGDDLVPIGAMLQRALPGVAFAFPEAPLLLPGMPGARAWWHIEISRFERAVRTGSIDELLEEVPSGLVEARRALAEVVDGCLRKFSLPYSRLVLGGFSQGSMVSTDLALHLEEAPGALAILSGTLLARSEWTRLAHKRAGLRVLQSHGHEDPILPFAAALALKDLLEHSGVALDFAPFHGGHGIPEPVLQKLALLLSSSLPSHTPAAGRAGA
ncbi:MAG TPA: phospholipase [Myxococcota bacterium]|jgi:phospholipase/carboxylesterase